MAYRNVVINGEVKRVPVDGATGRPTWGARAAAPEAEDQIAADPKLSKMTLGEMATSFFKALLTPRNIVILLVWLLVLKVRVLRWLHRRCCHRRVGRAEQRAATRGQSWARTGGAACCSPVYACVTAAATVQRLRGVCAAYVSGSVAVRSFR